MLSEKPISFKFLVTLLTVHNTAGASKHSCSLLICTHTYTLAFRCKIYFNYKLKNGIIACQTRFTAKGCSSNNRGSGAPIPMENYNCMG